MLEYLSERYGEVIAVVGMNPDKKYVVTPTERAQFIQDMISEKGIKGEIRVEVVKGYIWRFAMRENAEIFFRGIRTWEKDGEEERNLHILNTWGPLLLGPLKWPVPTYYLEGKPEYNHISSTLIRNMCREASEQKSKPDLSLVVPKSVVKLIEEAYSR